MAETKMKKTVAIIGAGPSGLTTARSMLAANLIPTLFEAKATLGGLWSPSSITTAPTLDPGLTLNHSRYTCAFSDLSWPETAPMFPPVTEMGQYLQRYRERYIPSSALKLSCPVVKITRRDGNDGWSVRWRDEVAGKEEIGTFDFLAICSGFFAEPYVPPINGLSGFKGQVLHSAEFEKLETAGKGKIVVVGGSMTGVEAAADLALRLASLPSNDEKPQIVHLFSRPFWNLAKYFAVPNKDDPTAPRFLPLDMLMYDFNARLADEGKPPMSLEVISRAVSEKMRGFVGHDQTGIAPELRVTEKYMNQMPWVSISDSYGHFVREGAIKPVLGRVESMHGNTLKLEEGEDYTVSEITDADTVVLATGYHPAASLRKILPKDLYTALTASSSSTAEIPPDPNFAPFLLYNHCLHPEFKQTAGFVGMYKGPYFGIMELQGRWLSALFSGSVTWPSNEDMIQSIKDLSTQRDKRSSNIDTAFRPQWAAPDYIGVVNDLRGRLGIPSAPSMTSHFPNTMVPAHFAPVDSVSEANKTLSELQRLLPPTPSTRFVAAAVFRGLQGAWKISRRIDSANTAFPSGTFTGSAFFHPREATFNVTPSSGSTDPSCAARRPLSTPPPKTPGGEVIEYLYSETGTFITDTGAAMAGARSYIYRYLPDEDALTVWFVKPDANGAVDYFFHELEFLLPGTSTPTATDKTANEINHPGGWKARSSHLCAEDWYYPSYRFVFGHEGPDLERFWVGYRVRGPKKEYMAEARYERP